MTTATILVSSICILAILLCVGRLIRDELRYRKTIKGLQIAKLENTIRLRDKRITDLLHDRRIARFRANSLQRELSTYKCKSLLDIDLELDLQSESAKPLDCMAIEIPLVPDFSK